ncbi:hypothetical protein RRG08_056750 [Elysia crispata]|uniref:Reverse transcriptase RNase H-like domain-containing protein n=1 Tax=Elysia crispata TaxID=231223 RepID=A0AAE0ZQZ4_9GAST|nr:hypothetical protein RRG08_056750 [Elysia crispata]
MTQKKPLVLQVGSSKDGLGCASPRKKTHRVCIQSTDRDGEKRGAQIEKEMLAIIFGLERFDQYSFGEKIIVISDHKPLETKIKKPLSQAPRRLQNLLMRGARYNFQINWACEKSLVIGDTLSRAFMKRLEGETDADIPQGVPGIPDGENQDRDPERLKVANAH